MQKMAEPGDHLLDRSCGWHRQVLPWRYTIRAYGAAGLRTTEIDALMTGKRTMEFGTRQSSGNQRHLYLQELCELVKVSDAEVLMRYGDDFYAGTPVVTHKSYGKGHVYYVGADMEQAFYSDFYGKAAKEAGIQAPLGFVPAEVLSPYVKSGK